MKKIVFKRKNYFSPLLLIVAILSGGLTGYFFPKAAFALKPIGTIFLNWLLTLIVPLVFFSVASAITRSATQKLGRFFLGLILLFTFTSIVAALYALVVVLLVPVHLPNLPLPGKSSDVGAMHLSEQFINILTVKHFTALFSHEHLLALIIFALLLGIATNTCGSKGESFAAFLKAGEEVSLQLFTLLMTFAPLGFFAYFSALVSGLGPQLLRQYFNIGLLYYIASSIYFVLFYSFYAILAGGKNMFLRFWRALIFPVVTAIATCSSAASIPANIIASKQIGVRADISETVIPIGAVVHKEGSIIGGMFKIAFLFALYQLPFNGLSVWLPALATSILVGTVMGAIPGGGMLGELLILKVYGFPSDALMLIAAISIIIDIPATVLNVIGNTVMSMLMNRTVNGQASI